MKTVLKNITFILFSLFLITNIFMFTSCGDGNDEPIEKEDQCEYCDDEQYDNTCVDGTECIYNERFYKIGNGDYEFRDFLYTSGMVDEKAASAVNDAQSHMNVMMDKFEQSLNGNSSAQAYFADYIQNMESIEYELDSLSGIDPVINKINHFSKPLFVDVIRNLDPLERDQYIVYHRALNAHVYGGKHGNYTDDVYQNYNEEQEETQRLWEVWNPNGKPFEIVFGNEGLTTESATDITNAMNKLHEKAADRMGHGITAEMLRHAVNNALTVPGLKVVDDAFSRGLHTECVALSNGTIVDAMDEEATRLLEQEN